MAMRFAHVLQLRAPARQEGSHARGRRPRPRCAGRIAATANARPPPGHRSNFRPPACQDRPRRARPCRRHPRTSCWERPPSPGATAGRPGGNRRPTLPERRCVRSSGASLSRKPAVRGVSSRVYTLKPAAEAGRYRAERRPGVRCTMFDTMTMTKAVGAVCGSLLVFLLLGTGRATRFITVGVAHHGGEGRRNCPGLHDRHR